MNRVQKIRNLENQRHFQVAAPLLSGIIIISAFPPFELGFTAWFALLPLLWACLTTSPAKAFRAGFLFSLPFTIYVNYYLAFVLYPYLSGVLATIALAALFIYISLFYGIFGLTASLASRSGRTWFTALALPSIWLIIEYIRSLTFLGYNVGYLGYTQWGYPTLLNIASVYGYWGLPFLMVFFQTIIILVFLKKLRGKNLAAASSIFAIILIAGLAGPTFQEVERNDKPLYTALIQGNIEPDRIINRNRQNILEHYLDMTRQAMEEEPRTRLVVWPETVVHLDLRAERSHPDEIVELGEEYGIDLLYGARIQKPGDLYNSIGHFSSRQEEITVYNKHRLVPFVEFFPAEQILNKILQLDLLLGSYTPGEELTIFDINGTPVAGVVCFESYFGDHMRLFAEKGALHQFVVTNDAWFGDSIGLEQHAQVAAIRAAETGAGVTQVANSGITISYDYRGKELFRSGKSEPGIFTVPLDMARRDTLYSRFGDYFPALWGLFLLLFTPCFIYKAKTTAKD